MYLLLFLTSIHTLICCLNTYEYICPALLDWPIRSKSLCNGTKKYSCLYDENKDTFREMCRETPGLLAPGYKYVIRGNLDVEDCYGNRYQPFIFKTNESSDCEFKKSKCSENGQVVVSNGSTTEDKSCRCDYSKSFAPVQKTPNPCHCISSSEDCSCYLKLCPNNTFLSQDYICKPDFTLVNMDLCGPIILSRWKLLQKSNFSDINLQFQRETTYRIKRDILSNTFRDVAVVLILSGIGTAIGFTVLISLYNFGTDKVSTKTFTSNKSKETTDMESNLINGTAFPDMSYNNDNAFEKDNLEVIARRTDYNARVGNDVVLSIEVHGKLASLVWIKLEDENEKLISAENNSKYDGGNIECPSLTIKNVDMLDNGCYQCFATDTFEQTQSTCLVLTVEEHLEDVQILTRETAYNIPAGDDAVLSIEVRGKLTELAWIKDEDKNERLISAENDSKYEGGTIECPSLTIKNVDMSDKGCYKCFATDNLGKTHDIKIEIAIQILATNSGVPITPKFDVTQPHFGFENFISPPPIECNEATGNRSQTSPQVVIDDHIKHARSKAAEHLKDEIRIVLVGKSGVGKSSTANSLLGRKCFDANCGTQAVTKKCMIAKGTIRDKNFYVVDTPGIYATCTKAEKIEMEIKRCVYLASPGPHAILFVVSCGRITEEDYNSIEIFLNYFGSNLRNYVIMVFTHVYKIGKEQTLADWVKGDHRLASFLKECCGGFCGIDNGSEGREKETYIMGLIYQIESLKKTNIICYTDDAIKKAEDRVQRKQKKKEESIRQEYLKEIENCIESKRNVEKERYDDEIKKLQVRYRRKLLKIREITRDEFLKTITTEDFMNLVLVKMAK